MRSVMLMGDTAMTAKAVARKLPITEVQAEVLAKAKVAYGKKATSS
jgi:cation transport ATPase